MPESIEYQRHDNKRQPHRALVQNLGGKKHPRRAKSSKWASASRLFDVNFSEEQIEDFRDEIEELQEELKRYQNEVITMAKENERFSRLEDNFHQLNDRVGRIEGDIKQISTKLDGIQRIEDTLSNLPDQNEVKVLFNQEIKNENLVTETYVSEKTTKVKNWALFVLIPSTIAAIGGIVSIFSALTN